MKRYRGLGALLLFAFSTGVCQDSSALGVRQKSGLFTYHGTEADRRTIAEIATLMDSVAPSICRRLDVTYRRPVAVEVYPTQASYDAHVMNPRMRGTPAVSGAGRIQLVSPHSPIAVPEISYRSRLWFAVHEFVHLVIDEIPAEVPLWLDEGVACHEGAGEFYGSDPRVRKILRGPLPALGDLMNSYSGVPAADVFSFSLVEYVESVHGRGKLNQLLRAPWELESILGLPAGRLAEEWRRFVASRYGSAL